MISRRLLLPQISRHLVTDAVSPRRPLPVAYWLSGSQVMIGQRLLFPEISRHRVTVTVSPSRTLPVAC